MTSPPVPVIQQQGADDRLQSALAPIAMFLQHKQKQQQEQQELLLKKGWLSLQQEQFAAQTKERNEQKKKMEEFGLQINGALEKGQNPEEDMKFLGGLLGQAVQTGQVGALKDAYDLVSGDAEREAQQAHVKLLSEFRVKAAQVTNAEEARKLYNEAVFTPGLTGTAGEILKTMGGSNGRIIERDDDAYWFEPGKKPVPLGLGAKKDPATEQQLFQRANALADDYRQAVDKRGYATMHSTVDEALQERGAAAAGDGAAQMKILYSFVTAMDPNSSVKEGEIGLAREAASIYDQVAGYYKKGLAGQPVLVPPALLKQMGDLMERRLASVEKKWAGLRQDYVRRGKKWKVEEDEFGSVPDTYSKPKATGTPGDSTKVTTPLAPNGGVLDNYLLKTPR